MRIAIVSDIHGNLSAFEAVLTDLRQTSPDLILHGGDLCDGGASPVEVADRIRDLGWQGVVGNGEEMLSRPKSLDEFARQSPKLQSLFGVIEEMATATREMLGEEKLTWLSSLPQMQIHDSVALVHASPEDRWRAPSPEADDAELEVVYGSLDRPIVVYAHIHRSYVRRMANKIIANTGSVSLSYDGDARAAYLLVDESRPTIRRVEYDVDKELRILSDCDLPYADWIAKTIKSGRPQMPDSLPSSQRIIDEPANKTRT